MDDPWRLAQFFFCDDQNERFVQLLRHKKFTLSLDMADQNGMFSGIFFFFFSIIGTFQLPMTETSSLGESIAMKT